MLSLSDRLTGPFNVELIILPLDISISDAIMNFQESGFKVTQSVFEKCGTPRLVKRSADESNPLDVRPVQTQLKSIGEKKSSPEFDFEDSNNDRETFDQLKGEVVDDKPQATAPRKSEFEKLVQDLRRSVRSKQGFWRHLPFSLCASVQDSIFAEDDEARSDELMISEVSLDKKHKEEDQRCWNGQDSAPYNTDVVEDGLNVANPEVALKPIDVPTVIKDLMFRLQTITNQLKLAHRGQDVEWWDLDEDSDDEDAYGGPRHRDNYYGSGSGDIGLSDDEDYGSGSDEGSGAHDDDEDDDEDVWGTNVEEGPWTPWKNDDKTEKTPSESDFEEVDDSINEIDDSGYGQKAGSGASSIFSGVVHKWEVTKTVIKFLLPTLACYMATAFTDSPYILA